MLRHPFRILFVALIALRSGNPAFGQESQTSPVSIPKQYASKYLVDGDSVSPDKQFAVMYPKRRVCEGEHNKDCQDFVVGLKPFRVIAKIETASPEFQGKNHGGMSVAWLPDSSAALVTLDSKWGPGDIWLFEIRDGKIVRSTDLLKQIHQQLEPDYRASKAGHFNDYYDFILDAEDQPAAELKDGKVEVHAYATTDPKNVADGIAWDGRFAGVWDIAQGKFTSAKVTREFAGVRKNDAN